MCWRRMVGRRVLLAPPQHSTNVGHPGKACTSILRLGLVLIGNHRPVPAEIPMSNDVPRYASRLIRLDAVAAVSSHCKGNPLAMASFFLCKTFPNRRLACGRLPMIGARRSVSDASLCWPSFDKK